MSTINSITTSAAKSIGIVMAFMFLMYNLCHAQQSSNLTLSEKLNGLTNFHDVMQVVEEHYKGKPDDWRGATGEDPRIKKWYRWAHYMSSHLDSKGNFVNAVALNAKAIKQMQFMASEDDRSINSFWFFMGPNDVPGGTGRVDRIAFHPTDPNIIYVGTPAGGVWYSDNNGDLWLPISDHIPSTGISGIVVSHTTPSDVYILTGDGDSDFSSLVRNHGYMRSSVGVLKSANGGNTWYATGVMSTDPFTGYKLIQDPNDENILIAATSIGIFRTTDGAQTWSQTATGKHYDVEYRPGSSDSVYAADDDFFYVSADSGKTFNIVSSYDVPLQSTSRLEIGVSPAAPSWVYLLGGGILQAGQFSGIYLSTDGGANFTQQVDTPNILGYGLGTGAAGQVSYDLCMDVSPTDATTVFTGGIRVWRSQNSGSQFTHVHDGHEDTHDVKVNPLSGTVFKATDGGVYRSTDNGASWTPVFAGMGTTQSYNMAVDPMDADRIVIGNQDCGVMFRNGNTDIFDRLVGGDGYDGAFAAGRDTIYATRNRQVYMYTDDGATPLTIFTPDSAFLGNIETHVSDPDIVFLGKSSVWRSDDAGATWDSLGVSGFWDVTTCPSNASRVYTTGGTSLNGGTPGLWRSDNLGDDWISLHDTLDFPELDSISKITEIGVRPNNSTHVWITMGGYTATHKVFRTLDGGGTWTNMTANLPNVPINCITITTGNDAYIGTDIGIFYRASDMDLWMPWSNNLPNTPVSELALADGNVIAATFGRGLWWSSAAEECVDALNITGQLEGEFHYEANVIVNSIAEIYHGLGTKVTYKAGQEIHLNPGFRARRLAKFKAVIGGCGEGGIVD